MNKIRFYNVIMTSSSYVGTTESVGYVGLALVPVFLKICNNPEESISFN